MALSKVGIAATKAKVQHDPQAKALLPVLLARETDSGGEGLQGHSRCHFDRYPHALALAGQVSKPLGCLGKLELLLRVEENRTESDFLHPRGMVLSTSLGGVCGSGRIILILSPFVPGESTSLQM